MRRIYTVLHSIHFFKKKIFRNFHIFYYQIQIQNETCTKNPIKRVLSNQSRAADTSLNFKSLGSRDIEGTEEKT